MGKVIADRMTATTEAEFTVFLIGMRINRPWKVHKWLPVALAMPRMVKELAADPASGFLGAESWFGNPTVMVQYWQSFDALEAYAKRPSGQHLPAWQAFSRAVGTSGDVGIWHETYRVRPGDFECVYTNMPPFGLGRVTTLVQAAGPRESAAGRMKGAA